jgi:hypothetical protein
VDWLALAWWLGFFSPPTHRQRNLDLVSASTSRFFDRHVLPQCQEILGSGMMAEICMNYGRIEKIHGLPA